MVLVSGNGSNLQALIDAAAAGSLDSEIVGVVSNRASAFALERAADANIATAVVSLEGDERAAYDRRLAQAVNLFEPDLVVLAGFMRILSSEFLDRFRVLNLHPALHGTFPGTHAIERAFTAWRAGEIDRSGVLVHWVPDEGVDVGPEILSAEVRFLADDTLETFETRMHEVEHRLLVEAVGQVSNDLFPTMADPVNGSPRPTGVGR